MKTATLTYLLVTACFVVAASAAAQAPADTVGNVPGVEIRTAVDQAEIFVGDKVTYTLTITYDSTIDLVPPPLGANLGAFQVTDYKTDEIEQLPNGRLRSTNRFEISTFTTGEYTVPPIPVAFDMPDGSRKVLLSEAVPITVESILAGQDSAMDIKPVAGPIDFERDRALYWIIGAIALVVILAAILLVIFWRRRETESEPVDTRPPWEIAFEKLAVLQNRNLIEEGRFKLYYYELSDILREYFGRVYKTNALDMTTAEFLDHFREIELPNSLYDGLEAFLTHADLVKFAKYEPEKEQTGYDFEFVHQAIDRVRADVVRRQQAETVEQTESSQQPPVATGGGGA